VPEYDAQHGGDEVDSENVIGIGEEPYTGDDNGTNMIPAKGSLVDLGKGKTSTFVGVFNLRQISVAIQNSSVPVIHTWM